LAKVKQDAEVEKLRESKVCNIIIYNVSKTNNHNRTERQKYDETINKILKVSIMLGVT